MAFVSNDISDEEQPNPAQGPIAPGGGGQTVRLAPSSGVGSTGGSPTPGSPSGANSGGQFASLNNYLSANQGQADPLASKITSGIGQQYNTLQGQNTSAINDINSQIAANATPTNYSDTLNQEAANPVSFSSDPGNVKSFQGLLNASYSGPASAESTTDYTNQQNAINNAISTGQNATQTEAGRENLLQQNEAAPTAGVTALNSAILSQSPTALNQVETAYQPFNNLLTGLQSGAGAADQTIAQNQTNATAANQQANAAIAGQIGALNNNVNNEYAALENQYNTGNTTAANVAAALQKGQLPPGEGVDQGLQSFLTNNIAPWMSSNAPGVTNTYNYANAVPQFTQAAAPTMAQAATSQDYANANAFQNLLAGLNTGIAAPILNTADASQAGTYSTPTLPTVNNKAIAGDIEAGLKSGAGPVNVNNQAFEKYNNLIAALDAYQGKWTPQFGAKPQPGDANWPMYGAWLGYHGGADTGTLTGIAVPS